MEKRYSPIVAVILVIAISVFGCKKNDNTIDEPQAAVHIDKLVPAQNIVGSDLLIEGSGFDPVATNNIVKIGNVPLVVKKATATSLLVNTPANLIQDKVTVSTGTSSATTAYNYYINGNPYAAIRLKSIKSNSDLYEFTYNSNNQLIAKNTKFINPINRLTFDVGKTDHTYNEAGYLIKEIYTPLNSSLKTVTEYSYTDGKLSGDKVYTLNTTDQSVSNVVLHSYTIVGRQLISKITKDANGAQLSSENYVYAIVNNVPQVTRTTTSSSGGVSTATYIQHLSLFDPSALLNTGAPKPTLFLASSATFTNDASGKNYTIDLGLAPVLAVAPSVRYQYAGGLADVVDYTYEAKQ